MERFQSHLALVMAMLFGFPTAYQFTHTLSHHITPHCESTCHSRNEMHETDFMHWGENSDFAKSCHILAYKGAVNELPRFITKYDRPALNFETILVAYNAIVLASEPVLFSSRAPPVILV